MRACRGQARPAGSARHSRRSAPSFCQARRCVLDLVGFDPSGYDLVVTGEGTVDRTTASGKAPGEVARRCAAAGVRCIVFGGRIDDAPDELEVIALSGDPGQARQDLIALGILLGEREAE